MNLFKINLNIVFSLLLIFTTLQQRCPYGSSFQGLKMHFVVLKSIHSEKRKSLKDRKINRFKIKNEEKSRVDI